MRTYTKVSSIKPFQKTNKRNFGILNEYNERKLDRLELDRQEERVCSDQPIYPQGWYEKQDKEIIYGKLAR